jgi:hypothetical protein
MESTSSTGRSVTCLCSYRPTEASPLIAPGTVAEVLFEGRISFGSGPPEPGVRLRIVSRPPTTLGPPVGKEFEIKRGTFVAWWG